MPNYKYKCQCGYEFETYQSIKAEPLKDCMECKKPTLQRVIHAAYGFVKGEPKTLAMLAERNTKRLGSQGAQDMWAEDKERKKLIKEKAQEELAARLPKGATIPNGDKTDVWYRPGTSGPNMALNNLTAEQTEKFIKEGTT